MKDSLVELSTAGQNTASTAFVGDFSTVIVLSHSGARTALPMGVKKGLELMESQLALLDLLCVRPVWLTARGCSAPGAY